jgi:outer membrane biosynthesis protein TonB
MRALARDPEERQPTMAALAQEIDAILAPLSTSLIRPARSKSFVAGIVGAAVVAGGLAMLVAGGRLPAIFESKPPLAAVPPPPPTPVSPAPEAKPASAPTPVVPAPEAEPAPAPKPSAPAREAEPAPAPAQGEAELLPPAAEPAAEPSARPVEAPPTLARAKAKPGPRGRRAAKHEPDSHSEQLLRQADAASVAGNHIEAIKLGTQALAAGGGVAAHLALAGYYKSLSRNNEALQHYRAAMQLDPSNPVAAAGIKVVERQLAPRP